MHIDMMLYGTMVDDAMLGEDSRLLEVAEACAVARNRATELQERGVDQADPETSLAWYRLSRAFAGEYVPGEYAEPADLERARLDARYGTHDDELTCAFMVLAVENAHLTELELERAYKELDRVHQELAGIPLAF